MGTDTYTPPPTPPPTPNAHTHTHTHTHTGTGSAALGELRSSVCHVHQGATCMHSQCVSARVCVCVCVCAQVLFHHLAVPGARPPPTSPAPLPLCPDAPTVPTTRP